MIRKIDTAFGAVLVLGSCGHTVGTILWVPFMSGLWVWSLGAALAGALLGVLNIVRAGRRDDKTLAVITAIGTGLWAVLAFTFGLSIHNVFDPRPLTHYTVSAVLVCFGIGTIRGSAPRNFQQV